ncbi:MAG: PaaI family thioesterase [Desulfosudaceae bacterium]
MTERQPKDPRLEKVIDHPLHQYLGITAIQSQEGRGRMAVPVTDNIVNPAGVLHGGVVYLLCDVCAYAGLLSLLAKGSEAVTHDIQVSVMQAAHKGDILEFSSAMVKLGKRLGFIDVRMTVDDRVMATARVTKSILP